MNRGNELPIVLYTTPEGAVKIKAVLSEGTMWLTQAGMSDLFGVAPQNITYHLKKIYAKLNAENAGKAVWNARLLGLIK